MSYSITDVQNQIFMISQPCWTWEATMNDCELKQFLKKLLQLPAETAANC